MYFMISLDAPQPPPYPSIWLFLPRVDFHWDASGLSRKFGFGCFKQIFWPKFETFCNKCRKNQILANLTYLMVLDVQKRVWKTLHSAVETLPLWFANCMSSSSNHSCPVSIESFLACLLKSAENLRWMKTVEASTAATAAACLRLASFGAEE